jgi:uncharacterized protein
MAHKKAWLWLAALLFISAPVLAQTVAELDGDWDGTLTATAGIKQRFSLHIESRNGVTEATLIAIDEGNTKVPVAAITRDGDNVTLDAAKTPGFFKGVLASDGQSIAGKLGAVFPITFTRRAAGAAAPAALKRPQEPKPPFPYKSEEVTFTGSGGVTLAGTLTTPQGAGPFPAVVLVQGSGPNDRDETTSGHKPFLVLADALTRRGIAVLRADKRGVGKSTGNYATATTENFIGDTEASVAWLRGLKSINGKKVGLIGHSEGGIIAPMVAAQDPALAFIVLLAGPGMKGEDLLQMRGRMMGQAVGVAPEALDKAAARNRAIFEIVRTIPNAGEVRTRVTALLVAEGVPASQAAAGAAQFAVPSYRFFLDHDPIPSLRQVKCPILAINGALDLIVPPKENLVAIKAALAANHDVTVTELPGLNHHFQTAKTGLLSEYSEIEETFAPRALALIADWVVQRAR